MRRLRWWVLLTIWLLGCGLLPLAPAPTLPPSLTPTASIAPTAIIPPTATVTDTPAPLPSPTPFPRPTHVLIISLDGFRPDAISPDRTPNILALAARGAYTWAAQTVLPSATLPAHGSMLSGYEVEDHGLTWNDYLPRNGYIRVSTIFTWAHQAGLTTAMLVAKQKLVQAVAPGTVDYFEFLPAGDFAIADEGVPLVQAGYGVLFIHFAGPDAAGHLYGWMSSHYLGTVAYTDQAVGRLLSVLDEAGLRDSTLVILTADHGGHDHVHGSARPEDTTIPWIAAGPGVRQGFPITAPVHIYDTAPTAAWALGLPLPEDLDGRPVTEAFLFGNP
ncbi:MAG: alkaline phosphatase family protein [Bacillota bacterium]